MDEEPLSLSDSQNSVPHDPTPPPTHCLSLVRETETEDPFSHEVSSVAAAVPAASLQDQIVAAPSNVVPAKKPFKRRFGQRTTLELSFEQQQMKRQVDQLQEQVDLLRQKNEIDKERNELKKTKIEVDKRRNELLLQIIDKMTS